MLDLMLIKFKNLALTLKFLSTVYIFLLLTIFILPFFTADHYSIVQNTTSQLGAQLTVNAWIMNLCFMLLGISSILAGWSRYQGFLLHKILLCTFGIALVGASIYRHAPIDPTLIYDFEEDYMHSIFASITGWSFCFLAFATAASIEQQNKRKYVALFVAVFITMLSILMFSAKDYMGIWQRLIFITAFAWMINEFGQET